MRFAGVVSRIVLVAMVLMVAAAPATISPARIRAQDAASRFEELLAARQASSSLAGPFAGVLVQESDFSTVTGAGLTTEDFSATATFVNPTTDTDAPWDFGFTFHRLSDQAQQIIVDSNGFWYYTPFPEDTLDSGFIPVFDVAPGGVNTIDLIVEGDTALLGVNGEFVASIALPPPAASDVQIGSGYFPANTVAGRAIPYRDFEVWALTAAGADEPPPTPALTAEPMPTVSPEDAAAFATLLAGQEQAVPLAGPFNANLLEEEGRISASWADVDVEDFHARGTFTVPASVSTVPWDIGFVFRNSPAGTIRVVVASTGAWYLAIGSAGPTASGPVANLVTEPGSANTLDLIVAEDTAVLGVNGELAAVIDIPGDSTAGYVAIAAAFFTDQTQVDRVTPFREFVVLPFDPNVVSTAEPTEPDAGRFASLLADTAVVTPLVGPLSGRLVELSAEAPSTAASGVALGNFAAVASFVTPTDVVDGLWDAGFEFLSDGDVAHRVILGFNGDIYAVVPGESPRYVATATTFEAAPGAVNTLQLFVEDGRALIGVNGEFVAAIDVAAEPLPADVLVGTAFFSEDFVPGRVTAYEDFKVWEIA
jgi:hypothetical protein